MGAARTLKHRFFALFLVLLLGTQKNRSEAEFGEANNKKSKINLFGEGWAKVSLCSAKAELIPLLSGNLSRTGFCPVLNRNISGLFYKTYHERLN